jgi:hypothetical protein
MRGRGYPGHRDSFGEIIVAQILIHGFHVGLNDGDDPLSDDIKALISVQAAQVGLCTF